MSDTLTNPTATLTPYDTGARGEPKPWTHHSGTELATMAPLGRALEEDRFGKVDFTNDESVAVCTVWLEHNEHGQDVLHVQPLGPDVILIQVHS